MQLFQCTFSGPCVTVNTLKGSTHKISPRRATCKLDVIEIQLSRLQIYNLHQVGLIKIRMLSGKI